MIDSLSVHPPHFAVREAVARAIAEDLTPMGDLTASLVDPGSTVRAAIVARSMGVIAGSACAAEAFCQIDGAITVDWRVEDGAAVEGGATVAVINGPLASVLTSERTALNFLSHLSGIATLTSRYVDAVAGTNVRILDTRKTTPGLRALEKAAVRAGGGHNHRGSLSEMVLVKDNHRAGLDITEAVKRAAMAWPGRAIEVECDSLAQVSEAVGAGAHIVMLDNFAPEDVGAAVAAVGRRALVEVSGRVTLETVAAYAAAGPDLISVGALTHSAPVLDLGLDLGSDG
ncbi:MAG TPA: carboxylating nicotinate-nucleotide diphosphorylase [Acidimicrobiales bacterium]|nr:carboxylating nicotinate-nucleotide diphosphorylase [Acidimicrobiales bacterium]